MNTITRQMTLAHIKATGHVRNVFDRMRNDDRGQGTLEYVGIAVAVLALVGAMWTFFNTELGQTLQDKITTAINNIGGGGDTAPATPGPSGG